MLHLASNLSHWGSCMWMPVADWQPMQLLGKKVSLYSYATNQTIVWTWETVAVFYMSLRAHGHRIACINMTRKPSEVLFETKLDIHFHNKKKEPGQCMSQERIFIFRDSCSKKRTILVATLLDPLGEISLNVDSEPQHGIHLVFLLTTQEWNTDMPSMMRLAHTYTHVHYIWAVPRGNRPDRMYRSRYFIFSQIRSGSDYHLTNIAANGPHWSTAEVLVWVSTP